MLYEKKLSAETEETKIGSYRKGKLTAGTGETNCQQVQERKNSHYNRERKYCQEVEERKKLLSGDTVEKKRPQELEGGRNW